MVHPCKAGNPGTVMHACSSLSATMTLCGLEVKVSNINITAGYTAVCNVCFPKDVPEPDLTGSQIAGREPPQQA